MAIAFRAVSTFSTGYGTAPFNYAIDKPTGVVSGDVMITGWVAGYTAITPPSGWELVLSVLPPGGMASASYIKVAGGSEPSTYTWTLTDSSYLAGACVSYSGCDTGTPQDVAAASQTAAATTAISAPSLTTATANTVLVCMFGAILASAFTTPTGMTERADLTPGLLATIAFDEQAIAAAGATGTRATVSSASTGLLAHSIALRPLIVPRSGGTRGMLTGVGS